VKLSKAVSTTSAQGRRQFDCNIVGVHHCIPGEWLSEGHRKQKSSAIIEKMRETVIKDVTLFTGIK
jgi:hypothetical protein